MENLQRHILIVEDNPGDFILVEDFIIECQPDSMISHAQTFGMARSFLADKNNRCDIVLLDLSLPDLTGEALIEQIISLCETIPVVVLTGYADFDFGIKSLSMGISDYLLKEDLTGSLLYKSMVYSTERKRIALALERSEQRARKYAGRLNSALEEERAHIAREIHDEFGQQLSGLKMSLAAIKRRPLSGNDLDEWVTNLIGELDWSIETVRRIANELRPVLMDKLGLFSAIEWLVQEFGKKTGAEATFSATTPQPDFDATTGINIFRICQEALTNIARHAAASAARIEISCPDKMLFIKIIDNGKGLSPDTLRNPISMGLMNMNERAQFIGAKLNIRNGHTEGTIVELSIKNYG
ncbi:Regulator of RpoS [compost metagenome]